MRRKVLVMDDYYDNDEYGQYENDIETWETNQVYEDEWLEKLAEDEAADEDAATEETDYEGIEF